MDCAQMSLLSLKLHLFWALVGFTQGRGRYTFTEGKGNVQQRHILTNLNNRAPKNGTGTSDVVYVRFVFVC